MVLLKYNDFELRTVETATGDNFPLTTGICIWKGEDFYGIVEPANDAVAKFTMYPALIPVTNDWPTINKLITAATDIMQSIMSII